jgi:hypothetical protein
VIKRRDALFHFFLSTLTGCGISSATLGVLLHNSLNIGRRDLYFDSPWNLNLWRTLYYGEIKQIYRAAGRWYVLSYSVVAHLLYVHITVSIFTALVPDVQRATLWAFVTRDSYLWDFCGPLFSRDRHFWRGFADFLTAPALCAKGEGYNGSTLLKSRLCCKGNAA